MTKINVINAIVNDATTTYSLSGGTRRFTLPISEPCSISAQVIHAGLTAADSTIKVQGSNDETNFDDFSNGIFTLSSSGSNSWVKDSFNHSHISFLFTAGSETTGTIKILLTIKRLKDGTN